MNTMDPDNSLSALHQDELPIDADVVKALIQRDMPALASLPMTPVESTGSTNVLFHLGDTLAVRLPRQPGGGEDGFGYLLNVGR